MDGNDTTLNSVDNISYSRLITVSSTEEDSRILATSYTMYKIGMYGHQYYIIKHK